MIEIKSGSEIGYSNDRPVLVIKHQMDKAAMQQLLPHIIKTLGADAVKKELDNKRTAAGERHE